MKNKELEAVAKVGGVVLSFLHLLVAKLEKVGGGFSSLHFLITAEGEETLDKIVELIVSAAVALPRLVVDYAADFEALAGKCNFTGGRSSNANAVNFPSKGVGQAEREFKLYHFNRNISSEDVVAEMDKGGFRPAEPLEFLHWLVANLKGGLAYPVICLGRVWRGRVLVVWRCGDGRGLDLFDWTSGWSARCRFLAVRK